MPRNKKQLKQLILQALLSGSDVINNSAIARKKNLDRRSVKRYLPEVYEKFINKKEKL